MSVVGRRRAAAAVALAVVVVAGLIVHGVLPRSPATDIAGDALYAVAVHTALVLLFARAPSLLLAVAAAAWCVAVELFQLTGVPLALAADAPSLALVFGTGFAARDLVVYLAAIAVSAASDVSIGRRVGMRDADVRLDRA